MSELPKEKIDSLVELCSSMLAQSYCPYSKFAVGAVLVTDCGKIFTGKQSFANHCGDLKSVCFSRLTFDILPTTYRLQCRKRILWVVYLRREDCGCQGNK